MPEAIFESGIDFRICWFRKYSYSF